MKDQTPIDNVFFDVHCHTLNLSHPCIYAFLKRFIKMPSHPVLASIVGGTLGLVVGTLTPIFGSAFVRKYLNLLSVVERNVGRIHMAMEDDLPTALRIGEKSFEHVSVSPLLMDFWADKKAEGIHYQFSPKSIVPQVLDVLNGISDYANTVRGEAFEKCIQEYPDVKTEGRRVGANEEWRLDLRRLHADEKDFKDAKEIIAKFGPSHRRLSSFPFMGLNTEYCYLDDSDRRPRESTNLKRLLKKYFDKKGESPYTGTYQGLCNKFGTFDGNLDDSGGDFFAGIKVYPPLGFDPWPVAALKEDSHNQDLIHHEQKKVEFLYQFCIENGVPIISHCSDGGFKVGDPKQAAERANPKRWKMVLENYPNLRLDLAHFGGSNSTFQYQKSWWSPFYKLFHGGDPSWVNTIIEMVETDRFEHIYTDISYNGYEERYYPVLKKITENHPKLEERLMFGSDFCINLLSINSYEKYLRQWLKTEEIAPELKIKMVNANPRKFLFDEKI